MHNFNINRRHFLKTASASLALSTLGPSGLDIIYQDQPLRVGVIGTGWYGKNDIFRLIQVAPVEVVSICDVDKNMLAEAATLISQRQKSGKKPRTYTDHRAMLAERDLDLVLIGTPDHWHALQAIDVLDAGAHLYLQKPISVDVLEGEAILAKARQSDRTVQIGTQRRSTPHLMEAKKNIVDAGLLGKVSHVEMCCYYHMRATDHPPEQAVPAFFDYDQWTGPAPMRPYDGLPHRRWRAFMAYGNGIVGDMCVHMFDTVRWMLDLGWPKRVSSEGGIYVQKDSKSTISDTQHATFEYNELNCVWQHRSWGTPADPDYPWAFTLYGDKGTLKGSVMQYDFIPQGKEGKRLHGDAMYEREKYPEDLTEKDIELHAAPATRRHMLDLLAAIKEKKQPVASVEQGHISSAACILANLSMQTGRPLVYDPQQRIVVGDPEATKLLRRPYRDPWQHPGEKLG